MNESDNVEFRLKSIRHDLVDDGSAYDGQHRLYAVVLLDRDGVAVKRTVLISQTDMYNEGVREVKHLTKKGSIFKEYTSTVSKELAHRDIRLHDVRHEFFNNHRNLHGHTLFLDMRVNDHDEGVLKERTLVLNQKDLFTMISKKLKQLRDKDELYISKYCSKFEPRRSVK